MLTVAGGLAPLQGAIKLLRPGSGVFTYAMFLPRNPGLSSAFYLLFVPTTDPAYGNHQPAPAWFSVIRPWSYSGALVFRRHQVSSYLPQQVLLSVITGLILSGFQSHGHGLVPEPGSFVCFLSALRSRERSCFRLSTVFSCWGVFVCLFRFIRESFYRRVFFRVF